MMETEQLLYIFNPENDLALAYGEEGYTAPPAARQLRRDLQMLPVWWSEPGSTILSQCCDADAEWLKGMGAAFGIDARCIAINHLQNHCFGYRPWGWNRDLRRRLLNECVAAEQLPEVQHIDKLRELSHRRISQVIHRKVGQVLREKWEVRYGNSQGLVLPEVPHEAYSVDEVRRYERLHPQCYIKAPWSSSGHGVYRVLEPESRNFEIWTQGVINRQGSIMCEPALTPVQDFAMEYCCRGGKAVFVGYSVFGNDSHSAFSGGIVAREDILREMIVKQMDEASAWLLDAVREAVRAAVEEMIAPHYDGYLGVDMMLYDDVGVVRLNPCIEVNLRMTMGAVTAIFAQRFLAEGVRARF
ncbi:MAG: hypothetical protein ACI4UN_00670, partial [Muribaculaceae bacterium]